MQRNIEPLETVLFSESRNDLGFNDRDTYGLSLILGQIQENIDRAAELF